MTQQEILQKVEWKDLRTLSFKEMLIENNLTIPWFIISLTLAYFGYYILALPFSAFFFLTGLRQVHNGFHNSLGTNKLLTWLSLYINSILMMVSIHAVKFNHIRQVVGKIKSPLVCFIIWNTTCSRRFQPLNYPNWPNVLTRHCRK